jgi:hypothetical protein
MTNIVRGKRSHNQNSARKKTTPPTMISTNHLANASNTPASNRQPKASHVAGVFKVMASPGPASEGPAVVAQRPWRRERTFGGVVVA